MASRNADVTLVIRAKNEAERTVNAVSDALKQLLSGQNAVAGSAVDLAGALVKIDKAYSAVAGSAKNAGDAFDRQRQSFVENNLQISALRQQADGAAAALAKLNGQGTKQFVGPVRPETLNLFKAITGEIANLEAQMGKLTREIGLQEAGITASESSLLRLTAAESALGDASAAARVKLEAETRALREKAAAASVVENINRSTGVTRSTATDSGATFEALDRAAAAAEREAAATDQLNQKLIERGRLEAAIASIDQRRGLNASEGALADLLRAEEAEAKKADAAKREVDAQAKITADLREQAGLLAAQAASASKINATVDRSGGKSAADSADVFKAAGPTPIEQQQNSIDAAALAADQAALRDAAIAYKQFEDRVRQGAAAMRDQESASRDEATAIAKLRDELDPLAAIQSKLAAETAKLNDWQHQGKISATELAAAEKLLKVQADAATAALGKNANGKPALFGLKPYEIQNLGYQVNDVVTQLASGTSLAQTLAQQGGQILQIFPKAGASIVAAFTNPAILAFVATLGVIALAIKHAGDEADRVRKFGGLLAASADGGQTTAAQLDQISKSIEHYGVSAADAIKTVRALFSVGVDPSKITAFGKEAKNLADILGIDVADAATKVADAFTGNVASVEKLDQSLNFLSAAERNRIRDLAARGESEKAVSLAFDIFSKKQDDAAAKQRGPWSDAMRSLSTGYHSFIDALSNTSAVQGILSAFEALAGHVERIAAGMKAAANYTKIAAATTDVNSTADAIDAAVKAGDKKAEAAARKANTLAYARLQDLRGNSDAASQLQSVAGAAGAPKPNPAESERTKKANQDLDIETDKLREQNKVLTDQQRIQSAISDARKKATDQIASDATLKYADDAHQRIYIEQQIGVARQAIEKKIADERKAKLVEEEQAIKGFSAKVVGPESGGQANAANPKSSALGVGQFLKGTFVSLFKSTYPEAAKSLSDDAIAALRTNVTISKNLIEVYARDNAAVLKKAGVAITEANLYAAHFLGSAGAVKLLKADPNTPVNKIGLSAAALKSNPGYLQNKDGSYKTSGQVQTLLGQKIGDSSRAEAAGAVEVNKLLDERNDKQTDFNLKISEENDQRDLTAQSLNAQIGLQDQALLVEQRKEAIADALLQKQKELLQINKALADKGLQPIEFTEADKNAVIKRVGDVFDAAHAREQLQARVNQVQRPVDDALGARDALSQKSDVLRSAGQFGAANGIDAQIKGMNADISKAYDTLIQFYQTLSPNEQVQLGLFDQKQVDNFVAKLQQAKAASVDIGKTLGVSNKDIINAFASSAASAFEDFIDKVAAGKNVFKSLGQSILEFAASFLRSMGEMIIKALAFTAALYVMSAVTGIPVQVLAGAAAASASVHHDGGIAGSGTVSRSVSPAWFSAAQRYHTGGIAGLKPNEVPAILEQGEEVLTTSDPRHRNNGGMAAGGASGPDIKNVILFDPGETLAQMLDTRVGQKAFLTHVRNNSDAVKGALG